MSFPLEAHLVHADENGNLAVVAIMFEQGSANKGMDKPWAKMPIHEGDKDTLTDIVAVDDILPKDRDYYRFNGSLTTPPCSEGVRWLVMKKPVSVSKEQIDAFSHSLHGPNNRPIQSVNSRLILQ